MFNWKTTLRCALLLSLIGCAGATSLCGTTIASDELGIGSDAPALNVEHWVQNGNGKFKPVTKFEKGKVYVVEFWATWCGPCIASMPHLVETQKKYADEVQIVSISNEDLETVEKFLEREVRPTGRPGAEEGDKAEKADDAPKTYRELTSAYCLTTDPDRSSDKDYMEAAGRNGIPCAFIVGKDQKVEWIGHPMSMDAALEAVVTDKWDREAFAEKYAEEQKVNILMAKIMRAAGSGKVDEALQMIDETIANTDNEQIKQTMPSLRIQVLLRAGRTDEALKALDELIEAEKNPGMKAQMRMTRVQLMLQDAKSPKLAEAVTQAYADYKDNPAFINFITWNLYQKFEAGELQDKALLSASRAAAEQAAASADGPTKGAILDTVAHFQLLDGDAKAALKSQEEAITLADDQLKPQLEKFLEQIKKEIK